MRSITYMVLAVLIVMAFAVSLLAAEGETKEKATTETKEKATTEAKGEKMEKAAKNPIVVLETNHGVIRLELFAKEAPKSVENFLTYVKDGFYDGTTFHRVVKGFVLQAGGINADMDQKKQRAPIANEATNGLKNERGTLSMARTSDINSGTSHFFINLVDNKPLDHRGTSPAEYGYAVFGKVADEASMKVVDEIAKVKVTTKGMFQNVPAEAVMIKKAFVEGEKKVEKKAESEVKKETKKVQKQMKED